MRKIILFLLFFVFLIGMSSCSIEIPHFYTAKEQLDFINDNLIFIDDSIKLGKSYPEIQDREDFTKYEKPSISQTNQNDGLETLQYDYNTPLSGTSTFYVFPKARVTFDGELNAITSDDHVITRLEASTDVFSLFGCGIGDSIKPLIKIFKERGFHVPDKLEMGLVISYGSILIGLRTDSGNDTLQFFYVTINNSISEYGFKSMYELNDFGKTRESIFKYFMPLDMENNCILWITKNVYMDDLTTSVSKVYFFSKSFHLKRIDGESIYETLTDPEVEDYSYTYGLLKKMQLLMRYYHINVEYPYASPKTRLADPASYFKNLDLNTIDIIIIEKLTLHVDGFKNQFRFDLISDEYNYIKEAIISDPRYEEFKILMRINF